MFVRACVCVGGGGGRGRRENRIPVTNTGWCLHITAGQLVNRQISFNLNSSKFPSTMYGRIQSSSLSAVLV